MPSAPSARVAKSTGEGPSVPSAIATRWRRDDRLALEPVALASGEKTGMVAELTIAAGPVGALGDAQNGKA